jgi:hypothetical protein
VRLRVVTLAERPSALAALRRIQRAVWPPNMAYINHDAVCGRLWPSLLRSFPEFQLVLCDARGRVVAGGYAIPFVWDGRTATLPMGVDGVLVRGLRDHRRRRRPNALSALLAVVDPRLQGRGLSREVIRAMALLAALHGMRALVAPVRPTLKHRYPLTPMARYVRWRRPDGAPLDPWLRVHWRLGARVLGIAARSMVVDGRVKDWEGWTGMRFPASGGYVVPGALTTVRIDRARDRGRYVEPNVWMLHPV